MSCPKTATKPPLRAGVSPSFKGTTFGTAQQCLQHYFAQQLCDSRRARHYGRHQSLYLCDCRRRPLPAASDLQSLYLTTKGLPLGRRNSVYNICYQLCDCQQQSRTHPEKKLSPTLGVRLDKKWTWNPHIEEVEKKATKGLSLEKKLAGHTCYTDGSSDAAVKSVGSGTFIHHPDRRTTSSSLPAGRLSTNCRAETSALREAARLVCAEDPPRSHVAFLTDCRSVIQSLQSPGEQLKETHSAC